MTQPLTHARIGYRTIWRAPGTIIDGRGPLVPGANVGRNAANELTYEAWQLAAAGTSEWEVTCVAAHTCDYVGVLHNLGQANYAVEVLAAGAPLAYKVITDDRPIMMTFDPYTTDNWQINFIRLGAPLSPLPPNYVPLVKTIFIGSALEMPRPIYGGHAPIALAREAVTEPNLSDSGQFIGRSVVRKGESGSFEWKHIHADWYRQNFDPFVKYLMEGPGAFFCKWRPEGFPNEVFYGWADASKIEAPNMGIQDLMSVTIPVRGFASDGKTGDDWT